MPILLDPAEIVEFSGIDAPAFAQAQFSTDINMLGVGCWSWSAWLDPQGRVRYLFALLRAEPQRLLAWLPRGRATDLVSAISPYVFRSKLRIAVLPDMYMFDAESDVPARGTIQTRGDGWLIGISDAPARGALLIRGDGSETLNAQRNAAWQLADVDQGLPWISSEVQGEFTAQALGLDRFGAISLNKGCYPGQEIVARLHFRGGNKRACYRVAVLDSLVPAPGTRVHSGTGGTALGTLLYAARVDGQSSRALAVLPADLEIGPDLQLEGGARVEVIARVNRAEPTP